jgi:hypothetical protein
VAGSGKYKRRRYDPRTNIRIIIIIIKIKTANNNKAPGIDLVTA